ncbi:MAG: hypothetical protein KKD69_00960 [Euryarchaeota archaeon]|nr:hypothetical protein [Euryarchaeota archaeon]MBU4491017.1 hypothetical protein [Euryarchaeota archaeon]
MSGKAEDKIQKITKLLEKGGTMLASHHECGAPMFRYQGKTICPVCDFQEKQEVKEANEIKETTEPPRAIKPQAVQRITQSDYQAVSRVIISKIHDIAMSLEAETDLQRVKNKMECVEQGIKILKLLQD